MTDEELERDIIAAIEWARSEGAYDTADAATEALEALLEENRRLRGFVGAAMMDEAMSR